MPSSDILRLAQKYRKQSGVSVTDANSFYDFAHRYRKIERRAFSLDRYRPLQALYEDNWPLIDVMKPAQRGVSEWAITIVCYALDQGARRWVPDGSKSGLNVGYVFPARADLIEFSKERLSGLKEESAYLAEMFGGDDDRFDSLAFKQVRDSFLYLRGGYSTTGLRSFPADVLILDEFDELDANAVSLARRRLNASLVKRLYRISTPTIPGRGISAAFAASDQRVYETPCSTCATECSLCGRPMEGNRRGASCGVHKCQGSASTWNQYDFFRDVWVDGQPFDEWHKWTQMHVEMSTVELRCPVCHKPQTPADRTVPGRWVSLVPEITRIHGYHIPWWAWPEPMLDMTQLAINAVSDDPTEVEQFYRSDLGIPHGAAGGQITADMLMQLATELPDGRLPDGPWRDTVMGADIGARIHYRIDSIGPDNKVYVREMNSVPTFEGLDELMRKFSVRRAVIDAEPEWHGSLDFCNRWKGRALRCFYPSNANALKTELFALKKDTVDIQANRTMLLDLVYATIAKGEERWPLSIVTDDEVVTHMTNMTRVRVHDPETGRSFYNWVRTGPDHGAHACFVAGTMVATEDGETPIESITPGMRVRTRNGFRLVTNAACTSESASVESITLSNGSLLTGTPNHPIWTENRGWVPLHALRYDDILRSCQEEQSASRSSPIKASYSGDIQRLRIALNAFTTCLAARIVSEGLRDCIKRYGKTYTDLSNQASMFITKTKIHSTTTPKILNCSVEDRTARYTEPNGTNITKKKLKISSMSLGRFHMHGEKLQKATSGTWRTGRKFSENFHLSRLCAPIAEQCMYLISARNQINIISALMFASLLTVVRLALMMSNSSVSYAKRYSEGTNIQKEGFALRSVPVRLIEHHTLSDNRSVYNLSVADEEEYFANGVLVHNCGYALLARRTLPQTHTFAPAVSGGNQVVSDYQRVATQNLGHLVNGRGVPVWIPPAVR